MCAQMRARGPDAEGYSSHLDGRIGFGHRRLAIIDLDARANQPFNSDNGTLTIIFNGEIYNYRELRKDLEAKGARFRTHSDTEVVLAAFERWGTDCFRRLRGMFALAVFDAASRTMTLARDPHGIKPLYYSYRDGVFAFASQVKALRASGASFNEPDLTAQAAFRFWGHVPEPLTWVRGIVPLPAGASITVTEKGLGAIQRFHDIAHAWRRSETLAAEHKDLQAFVTDQIDASIRYHLVADVPIAVFLSGGIDSSVVAGLCARQGAAVQGVTIAFDEYAGRADDEAAPAAAIAKHLGIPHHVRRVSRAEFEVDLPKILDAMDQPSIDGVNTWFASKAVKELNFKVVLSGVGGDELFGGYAHFRNVPRLHRLAQAAHALPFTAPLMSVLGQLASQATGKSKWATLPAIKDLYGAYALARSVPPRKFDRAIFEAHARAMVRHDKDEIAMLRSMPPASAIGMLETTHYMRDRLLRDSDWASMAHSVELRTPLVDSHLTEALAAFAPEFVRAKGKAHLRNTLPGGLPLGIATRAKTGFGVPMDHWLRPDGSAPAPRAGTHWTDRFIELVASVA